MGSRVFGPSSLTAAKPAYSAGGSARAPKTDAPQLGQCLRKGQLRFGDNPRCDQSWWLPGDSRSRRSEDLDAIGRSNDGAIDRVIAGRFYGIVEARVQNNLGFRVPGKVIQRLSFATSSLKNRCKVVQYVPSPGPGRLIAEPDGSGFAGSPPKAKIASARRHHS
jgi:hypothetical protein